MSEISRLKFKLNLEYGDARVSDVLQKTLGIRCCSDICTEADASTCIARVMQMAVSEHNRKKRMLAQAIVLSLFPTLNLDVVREVYNRRGIDGLATLARVLCEVVHEAPCERVLNDRFQRVASLSGENIVASGSGYRKLLRYAPLAFMLLPDDRHVFVSSHVPERLRRLLERVKPASELLVSALVRSGMFGEISGVRPMRSYSELTNLVPSEQALMAAAMREPGELGRVLRGIVAEKIASKSMLVWDKRLPVYPVFFIDVSGSMVYHTLFYNTSVPRLDAAKAITASLLSAFKKGLVFAFSNWVYFIGDASNERTIRMVLGLIPYGGTNMDLVLRTIVDLEKGFRAMRKKPVYVIITDTESNPNIPMEIENDPDLRRRIIVIMVGDSVRPWVNNFPHIDATKGDMAIMYSKFIRILRDAMLRYA